jgi:hypothetical protein
MQSRSTTSNFGNPPPKPWYEIATIRVTFIEDWDDTAAGVGDISQVSAELLQP